MNVCLLCGNKVPFPPCLNTRPGQGSLCVADIEQSLWTAMALTAELPVETEPSVADMDFCFYCLRFSCTNVSPSMSCGPAGRVLSII